MSVRVAVVAILGALSAVTAVTVTTNAPAASAGSSGEFRVGTFNIVGVNVDKNASGERKVWRARRATVIGQILRERLDVVGVQEANQSTIYRSHLASGKAQFLDLRNGLNAAGGHYALTSPYSYNCYRPFSSRKCHYKYRAASGDDRILYNTSTMKLVYKGSYRYRHQVRNSTARWMTWAVLRVRATGKTFLFTSTHLDPYSKSVRVAQWHELIRKVNHLKGSRPVIAVGDYNTSKFSTWARTMLPAMVNNGYGDALGQRYKTNGIVPRQDTINRLDHVWVNSFNAFRRDVASYGYQEDSNNTYNPRTGNGVDWIFASNSRSKLRVKAFEVVANMNDSNLQITGTIPSDHHMLRATISLG